MATVSAEQQKILEGFQKLRELQQQNATEIGRVEVELREHQTVLKSIQQLEPKRKCFRQIGDSLVEHKAEELVSILTEVSNKFKERINELNNQLLERDAEINVYKEKNNIRLLSQKDVLELQRKQALDKISQINLPKEKS